MRGAALRAAALPAVDLSSDAEVDKLSPANEDKVVPEVAATVQAAPAPSKRRRFDELCALIIDD